MILGLSYRLLTEMKSSGTALLYSFLVFMGAVNLSPYGIFNILKMIFFLSIVGLFLLAVITNSSSGSNSSQPWVAVDYDLGNLIVAIVVGLGGSVLTLAVLITSLVKNKAEYKRSLKKLSNPAT